MYVPDLSQENIAFLLVAIIGIGIVVARELNPDTRLAYSKFASHKPLSKMPSRWGMLFIYIPSAAVSMCFLVIPYARGHIWTTAFLNSVHYAKRIYEVLFLHKYSGSIPIRDAFMISSCYAVHAVALIYLTAHVPRPSIVPQQVIWGTALFTIGEIVNHVHHRILAELRSNTKDMKYKVPQQGLFCFVWCPHYLGEIIAFVAMGVVSQNSMSLILQMGSAAYLAVRARNTRTWYESKFPGVASKAALIPRIL